MIPFTFPAFLSMSAFGSVRSTVPTSSGGRNRGHQTPEVNRFLFCLGFLLFIYKSHAVCCLLGESWNSIVHHPVELSDRQETVVELDKLLTICRAHGCKRGDS